VTLSLDDIVFRSRALAQTHPFTRRAQAYLNSAVAREKADQPVQDMAIWASHAMTVGYCLRRVEEQDDGRSEKWEPAGESIEGWEQLEELTTNIANKISTEQASDFLLYPEPILVDALDRIIGGEVDRRLSDIAEGVDSDTFAELEQYVAWWTLKGYSLRVAEQLATADRQE